MFIQLSFLARDTLVKQIKSFFSWLNKVRISTFTLHVIILLQHQVCGFLCYSVVCFVILAN